MLFCSTLAFSPAGIVIVEPTSILAIDVPVGPVAPVGPTGPVGPVLPVIPVAPVGPVGPVAPVTPCLFILPAMFSQKQLFFIRKFLQIQFEPHFIVFKQQFLIG